MSFSGRVKEELAKNISRARHCRIAELAAFIGMCGTVVINRFDFCSVKITHRKSSCCKKGLYIDRKNI